MQTREGKGREGKGREGAEPIRTIRFIIMMSWIERRRKILV